MNMSIEVFLDMPAKEEEEEANPTLFANNFMFWHSIINIQWINVETIRIIWNQLLIIIKGHKTKTNKLLQTVEVMSLPVYRRQPVTEDKNQKLWLTAN